MQLVPNSIFEFPQMQRLLDEEGSVIEQRMAAVTDGPVLSIAPIDAPSRLLVDSRRPIKRLHVAADGLAGDACCPPDALPWAADSFQVVIARHVVDALPADSGIEAELVRVLAPGGVLMLCGLNPLSPWRLWWSRSWRNGDRVPIPRHVASMQRTLENSGMSMLDQQFIGGVWPRSDDESRVGAKGPGARWHGAWLLVTSKQPVSMRMMPLPYRRPQARLGPAFVPSSSGRHCA
ncbi:MAG: methyltransferase domain-containing protein [Dokdonella sp.]